MTCASPGRQLQLWLLSGAALTFLILVVGGITRLTLSGLSIVEWKPITGVIPPLSDADWSEAFLQYQRFPEYQKLRQGMTLSEFRSIFLWEYAHRLLARLLGLVFALPCAYFWLRGYFDRRLWLARDLARQPPTLSAPPGEETLTPGVYLVGALLLLQILWGAFTAGLHAGLLYNTFPKMGEHWVPLGADTLQPALRNLVANPIAVQWVHRVLGTVLAVAALVLVVLSRGRSVESGSKRLSAVFAGLVLAQYALGVVTLLHRVPVVLGALHQATAVVVFATWVLWFHHLRRHRARATVGAPVHRDPHLTAARPT